MAFHGGWNQGGNSNWTAPRWQQQQQQGAQPRPVQVQGTALKPAVDTYVVYSRTQDADEVITKTLAGDYVEQGMNHGRKYFKKTLLPNSDPVDVFLYYWDARDGPPFEGWWFGNKLGGTQVWSHVVSKAMVPPTAGWKIPWDGQVRPSLAVELKGKPKPAVAAVPFDPKNNKAHAEAGMAQEAAKTAMVEAKNLAGDMTSPEAIEAAEKLLTPQVAMLMEALKKLLEAQKVTVGESSKQLAQLSVTLRTTQNQVNGELMKLRAGKTRCAANAKTKAADEHDLAVLRELLPEATQKTNAAEDAVEKAAITSEMIQTSGDDMEEVRLAVTQTEQSAQEAQKALGEAKIHVNAKIASCRRFTSEKAKQQAVLELGKLQAALQEAQNKLTPLKTVRQDFIQKMAAQKVVQDTLERLTPAEVDVDRAAEVTNTLTAESTPETLAQIEEAIGTASDKINTIMKFLASKKATAQGAMRDEVGKLEERTKTSVTRLGEMKTQLRQVTEKAVADTIIAEATQKLQTVRDAVKRASDAEGPFLMGLEDLSLQDTLGAVKACEAASTAANTSLSVARMFIATKLVEAKRFTPELSKTSTEKLKELQGEVETHLKRLTELKKANAERRGTSTMREGERLVALAEQLTKQVVGELEGLLDISKLTSMTMEEMKATLQRTSSGRQGASEAVSAARKFVTNAQIECKGKDLGTGITVELTKYQSRLAATQAELTKLRRADGQVEQHMAAKRVTSEAASLLDTAEQKVHLLEEKLEALGEVSEKVKKEKEAEAEAKAEAEKEAKLKEEEQAAKQEKEAEQQEQKEQQEQQEQEGQEGQQQEQEQEQEAKKEAEEETAEASQAQDQEQKGEVTAKEEAKGEEEEAKEGKAKEEDAAMEPASEAQKEEETKQEEEKAPPKISAAEEFQELSKSIETIAAEAQVAVKAAVRHIELQANAEGLVGEAIGKLQPKLGEVQAKLAGAVEAMKEHFERRKVDNLIEESAERVAESEAHLAKVFAAEEPFRRAESVGTDLEEPGKCIAELELALDQAGKHLGGTKTFLAMKKLAAKRFSEASAARSASTLAELQTKLEEVAKGLMETKKGMLQRRTLATKREAERRVVQVEAAVAEAGQETAALLPTEDGQAVDPEFMRSSCQKAGTAQQTASAAITETRSYLQKQQKDMKLLTADPSLTSELVKLMERLTKAQSDLDHHRAALRDQEHRFVARRLLDDANEIVADLERHLESATQKIEPLLSARTGFYAGQCLSSFLPLLRSYISTKEGGIKAVFDEMRGESENVTQASFTKFVAEKIPTPAGEEPLSEEQVELVFQRLDTESKEQVTLEMLEATVRIQFSVSATVLMTDKLAVKGGKTVRKLEVGESVDQLEDPVKDPDLGLTRIKGRAEKDGKEGYITVAGNQGTSYLSPVDLEGVRESKMESILQECGTKGLKAQKYIDAKINELKSLQKGPLADTKSALQELLPRIRKVAEERKGLRAKILEAKRKHSEQAKALEKQRAERALKQAAEEIMSDIKPKTEVADAKCTEALEQAGQILKKTAAEADENVLDASVKELDASTDLASTALESVKEALVNEKIKTASEGPLREARALLIKLKVRMSHLEGHCKKQSIALRALRKEVVEENTALFKKLLRSEAAKKELSPQDLYKHLAENSDTVSAEALYKFIESAPEAGEKEAQLRAACRDMAANASSLSFASTLEEYYRCTKEIAITTALEMGSSKPIRKLAQGEIVEAVGFDVETTGSGPQRRKCRTLLDNKEGWVTLKGNQGTDFMVAAPKPYVCYLGETALTINQECDSSSDEVGALTLGELCEVLEGPKKEAPTECLRVRGQTTDGKIGWTTLLSHSGKEYFQLLKVKICKQSIALTNSFDIKEGKSLRKLEVGEAIEVLEEAQEDTERKLLRAKVKARSDGIEGYVTIKGNQGTSYVEDSDSHYACQVAVPFQKRFSSQSEEIRELAVGEMFQALDDPKNEAQEGAERVKVRSCKTGATGWVLAKGALKDWSLVSKVTGSVPLHEGVGLEEPKELRTLEASEQVELLAVPQVDEASGELRVKCRALRDGLIGFISLRGEKGTEVLKPMLK